MPEEARTVWCENLVALTHRSHLRLEVIVACSASRGDGGADTHTGMGPTLLKDHVGFL